DRGKERPRRLEKSIVTKNPKRVIEPALIEFIDSVIIPSLLERFLNDTAKLNEDANRKASDRARAANERRLNHGRPHSSRHLTAPYFTVPFAGASGTGNSQSLARV